MAKAKHDGKSFYGNTLAVGYAPAVDSIDDVRAKLEERVELLQRRRGRRGRRGRRPPPPPPASGSSASAAGKSAAPASTAAAATGSAAMPAASAVAPEFHYESAAPVVGQARGETLPAPLGGAPPSYAAPSEVAVAVRVRARLRQQAGGKGRTAAVPGQPRPSSGADESGGKGRVGQ